MLSNTTNKKKASKQKVLKQIAISQENYDALQKLGNVPESFNDVITKVLDYYKTR
jgi:predicted CopG family antitoxin